MEPQKDNRPVEPPGLERTILRKLPSYTVASIVGPLLFYLGTYYFSVGGDAAEKLLTTTAIIAVSISLTLLTIIFTVAIGCWFVVIMKGPVRTADSYPLSDADKPRKDNERDEKPGSRFEA